MDYAQSEDVDNVEQFVEVSFHIIRFICTKIISGIKIQQVKDLSTFCSSISVFTNGDKVRENRERLRWVSWIRTLLYGIDSFLECDSTNLLHTDPGDMSSAQDVP